MFCVKNKVTCNVKVMKNYNNINFSLDGVFKEYGKGKVKT